MCLCVSVNVKHAARVGRKCNYLYTTPEGRGGRSVGHFEDGGVEKREKLFTLCHWPSIVSMRAFFI